MGIDFNSVPERRTTSNVVERSPLSESGVEEVAKDAGNASLQREAEAKRGTACVAQKQEDKGQGCKLSAGVFGFLARCKLR